METREQQGPLPWTQEDVVAARRLIEPIGLGLGIKGQDLDDVVQESLIVALKKYDGRGYDSENYNGESFSSPQIACMAMYACKCVKRNVLNRRRRAFRRTCLLHRVAESITPDCIGVSPPTQFDEITFLEEAACVERHLSQEENQMREMLESEFTPEEISERLEITIDACYKRISRLRRKVVAILSGVTPPTEPDGC